MQFCTAFPDYLIVAKAVVAGLLISECVECAGLNQAEMLLDTCLFEHVQDAGLITPLHWPGNVLGVPGISQKLLGPVVAAQQH